jgi:hypothetical protein
MTCPRNNNIFWEFKIQHFRTHYEAYDYMTEYGGETFPVKGEY